MIASGRTTYSEKRTPKYKSIEKEFTRGVFEKTAEKIRDEQNDVVADWNLVKTDRLKNSLVGHFSISELGSGGVKLSMSYLVYARWLDMQDERRQIKREGYHLYNRIIFGTIYPYTLHKLRFGLTKEVREIIENSMNRAGFTKN